MDAHLPQTAPSGLPVEEVIDVVRSALGSVGVAVLQAEPGAGKTTIVPLRLLGEPWVGEGRIVLLEPRRVAARAAASRMADLLGEKVGGTVGYSTRDERRVTRATRIEVVTDGILTRRIQRDPSLEGTALLIFDEFHERHLQADLGLALTLDAREGLRPDLRVLVMSATIDTGAVAAFFGDAPVVSSRGRTYPVEVRWAPQRPNAQLAVGVGATVRAALERDPGDVLVFLPGTGEIRAAQSAIGRVSGVDLLPLHGTLSSAEQDRALRAGPSRRVVLSTDLAESSVTVEGVSIVIDSGLVRRPAYDPASGLSRLRTLTTSRASADQRAGRSGRTAPGVAYRMWSESEHLARRAWPDPEITTADLAPLALELAAWGAPPEALRWLDPPPPAALAIATELLEELGALDHARPTELGRSLLELPLHPRLGRMLIGAPTSDRRAAALLAALLSERDIARGRGPQEPVSVDVATRLAVMSGGGDGSLSIDRAAVATVKRRADELLRRLGAGGNRTTTVGHLDPGPLLAAAFPDRIAQSRGASRYRLRHGSGATLPDHDPLTGSTWLVAAEIEGAGGLGRSDGRIRLAAALDRSDIEAIGGDAITTVVVVEWDDQLDDLRATTERRLDALVLDSTRTVAPAGPESAAALLAHAVKDDLALLGWTAGGRSLQARVGWAREAFGETWPDVSDGALIASAEEWLLPLLGRATGRAVLEKIDPASAIRSAVGGRMHELDELLPAAIELAGGRRVPVDYTGERPRVAVRAQDLYGTTSHPTVAGGRVPVTVELLSPAGRPIQITADLPGFWAGTWKVVRREMATRYPRHSWPEDPSQVETPPRKSELRRHR